MLLVYYNTNQKHFYIIYTKYDKLNYYVGYTNQFNHIIVQIFYIYGNKLYNINCHNDIYKIFPKKERLRNRLITRIVRGLNKLKG